MVPPPVKPRRAPFLVVLLLPFLLLLALEPLLLGPLKALYELWILKFLQGRITRLVFFTGLFAPGLLLGAAYSLSMSCYARRWARKSRRFDRWRRQRCTQCDYDLRAHQGGGNCPECAARGPEKFQPPNPVPPPQRPRSLWLTIPLLALPLVAMIWLSPFLDAWNLDAFGGTITTVAYTLAAIYIANRHVTFHRWKNLRCTRCRCDLRPHLAQATGSPAICPQCGTPIPIKQHA